MIKLYRYDANRRELISPAVFKPLDDVRICIRDLRKKMRNGGKFRLSVVDASNKQYVEKNLVFDNTNTSAGFIAGGALGRHTVYLYGEDALIHKATFDLKADTTIITSSGRFDKFYKMVKSFMLKDIVEYRYRNRRIRGYRASDSTPIWLRDHTHQMKGFKYWEKEMKSVIDHFAGHQLADGSFFELLHSISLNDRCEIEADVEYLMVEAVYSIWQATGDDVWMFNCLDKIERGIIYSMSNSIRWLKEYGLVKRGFTIDTWDIQFGDRVNHISDNTKFGIMHGDNSGIYKACRLLAIMFNYAGEIKKRNYWNKRALQIKANMLKYCWSGKFYTHRVEIDPVTIPGFDQSCILSLSNVYDINRGVTTQDQAVKIIQEYKKRKSTAKSNPFAEWFSIDPPFPYKCFKERKGQYVNGGIMPLVGGELAKACFDHGFEEYGLSILNQYIDLITKTGKTYLWYWPDETPGVSSKNTLATDGWGSSAMLYGFMEGLIGIEDKSKRYENVNISPRLVISGEKSLSVTAKYGASNAYFSYNYKHNPNKKEIEILFTGSGTNAGFHVLLPKHTKCQKVFVDDAKWGFHNVVVRNSLYADFAIEILSPKTILLRYKKIGKSQKNGEE